MHWEYWPSFVVYAPAAFFYLYFALRSWRLFYFTPVNPVIETGGVFGESKINILNRIPKEVLPKTVLSPKKTKLQLILKKQEKMLVSPFRLLRNQMWAKEGF